DATPTAVPQLAQETHRLHPSEALLDQLPFLLADGVAGMTGGARINRTGTADRLRKLSEMRRHAERPEDLDEASRVVIFVASDGDAMRGQVGNHRGGRVTFGGPGRMGDERGDDQAVTILGDDMPQVRELGFHAGGF